MTTILPCSEWSTWDIRSDLIRKDDFWLNADLALTSFTRWSHKDLATLTADGIRQEMTLLEEAMVNILGYFPYYMRPPFLSVNAQALSVLGDLDYHVIIGDLNTKDWEYQTQTGIETAKKLFTDGLDIGYTIVESHDQEVWTHDDLINFMIATVQSRGLKSRCKIPT